MALEQAPASNLTAPGLFYWAGTTPGLKKSPQIKTVKPVAIGRMLVEVFRLWGIEQQLV
jgi:hypothetical protein